MSIFSKLFGKQSSSLPKIQNTSPDWRDVRHPNGLFSLRIPSDWQEISPLSPDAVFAAVGPARHVLLEIFCVQSKDGPGKTGFDAATKLARAITGWVRSRHPDVREVWQGNGGTSYNAICRRLIIEYTERFVSAGKRRSGLFKTDHFFIGSQDRVLFANFKLLSSEYSAWETTFERIVSSISIPYVGQIRVLPRASVHADASSSPVCGRERARALEREGKHEEALEVFSQAVREEPNNAIAYVDRGVLLSVIGRYDESVADYTRALEIDSSDSVAYNNRGIAYLKLGKSDEALADIEHALRLNPGNAHFRDNQHRIQSHIEERKLSQSQTPLPSADSSPATASPSTQPMTAGFLDQLSPEERSAVSNHDPGFYEVIIAAKKGGYTGITSIGVGTSAAKEDVAGKLLWKLSDPELKRLAESVRYTIRADAAVQSDHEEAARLYRQAFELNPYDEIPIMSYGVMLAQQGDVREGIKWLEHAVEVNPKSERARQNLEALKSML
jgi:tetratricopeptide (TPR) repeat protein